MLRPNAILLSLTILSTTAVLQAQSSQTPAPIEHAWAAQDSNGPQASQPPMAPPAPQALALTLAQPLTTTTNTATAEPAPGVFVRAGQNTTIRAITLDASHTELRIEKGIANISIHHSQQGTEILVDLPGGQTGILKDGLYTFNAATNTVRVFKGEADAYLGANVTAKPIKVKEDHAVTFSSANLHSVEFGPLQARADLIPYTMGSAQGPGRYGDGAPYGSSFYGGYPYYGYPYYAYGYGYPYGYYGYPGLGFGLGYYGGFGYGFRGGYGGGFGGGGFRGGRR